MHSRSSLRSRLQRQLLLWTGAVAVAVALSLLAMHQLSGNHTAAQPRSPDVVQFNDASGLTIHDAHPAGHDPAAARTDVHTHREAAVVAGWMAAATDNLLRSVVPTNDACPGCTEHQAMTLTCLVALTLLVMGWLLRRPLRWPGLLPRRWSNRLSHELRGRRWRPPLSLVELSVSRT